jgi:hypothetical protein
MSPGSYHGWKIMPSVERLVAGSEGDNCGGGGIAKSK